MSKKYHISSDGIPRECRATVGKCRFGDAESHYDSIDAARTAFEEKMKKDLFKKQYDWPEKSETITFPSKRVPDAEIVFQVSDKFSMNFNGTHHSLEAWLKLPGTGNVAFIRLLVRDSSYSSKTGDHLAMCDIETRIDQRGKGYARALREDIEEKTGLLIYSSGGYTPEGWEAFGKHGRYISDEFSFGETAGVKYNSMGFVLSWKDQVPLNVDRNIDYTDDQREAIWKLEKKYQKFRNKEILWSKD